MPNNNIEIAEEARFKPRPDWLRVKLPTGKEYAKEREIVFTQKLHTIRESGICPNMGECWGAGSATFNILGNICTCSCGFCNVANGSPLPADLKEPEHVAESVRLMNIKHCVITSVNRNDLKDGGSIIWVETINAIRKVSPQTKFETFIPDSMGHWENLKRIKEAHPDIVSHNTETVRRLTKQLRVQAKYDRSLEVLQRLKEAEMKTKSRIMLGLGETEKEIYETIGDLRAVGCDVVRIGKYLQPSKQYLPVVEFIHPEIFAKYKVIGFEKGFRNVESGHPIRSSQHADKHIF